MAITDSSVHVPTADYNTDIRPAQGASYVDAVFGETVRRYSNIGAAVADDDMYAHCRANADGTYLMRRTAAQMDIIRTSDGTVVVSAAPDGSGSGVGGGLNPNVAARTNAIFHPTNPNKYFYLQYTSTPGLYEYTIGSGGVRIKDFTFASDHNLDDPGGSINWTDKTGRYFLVVERTNLVARVWDRQTDTLYTGNVPMPTAGGLMGLTPSGSHVVGASYAGNATKSFAINHGAQTVDTTGVTCWKLGDTHVVLMSASDGHEYVIRNENVAGQGLYSIDITVDRSAMTDAQQRASAVLLVDSSGFDFFNHMTAGPNGAGQDWVFLSFEDFEGTVHGRDRFNDVPNVNNQWDLPFKQEIVAKNILTLAHRRLAHHRSRNIQEANRYYYQPRPSCSWDGSFVFWASNQNVSTTANYADSYGIVNPLGAQAATPPPFMRMGGMVNLHQRGKL